MHLNNGGRGKGIVTFSPSNFVLQLNISEDGYQITSIESSNLTIINVYRSSNSDVTNFIKSLAQVTSVNDNNSTIICGDLNLCQRDENNHPIIQFLEKNNFIAGFNPPQASHKDGRCLDQVFFRLQNRVKMESIDLRPCYFSDHDTIDIVVSRESEKSEICMKTNI